MHPLSGEYGMKMKPKSQNQFVVSLISGLSSITYSVSSEQSLFLYQPYQFIKRSSSLDISTFLLSG